MRVGLKMIVPFGTVCAQSIVPDEKLLDSMKRLVKVLSFGMLIAIGPNVLSQEADSKRVLFLGNSVFHSRGGVAPTFEGFCKEAGLDYQAVSPQRMRRHTHGLEFLDFGRIPLNLPMVAADKKIHALIRDGDFDYVIIEGRREGFLLPQEAGLSESRGESIPYEKNVEALGSIHRTIVKSGAQTVLYMHPGAHADVRVWHVVGQIYQRFHADLEEMEIDGRRREVILVPAKYLWLDAIRQYGVEGWFADAVHGNALARYASACMLYTYITGKDPRVNGFRKLTELSREWKVIPEKVNLEATNEDAKWIKDQVWLYYSTRK